MIILDSKENIFVKTGLNLEYAKNFLTTDISCKDSIYDLVDNCIDAARNSLYKDRDASQTYFVEENFEGFEISIGFSKNIIWIEDNCSGIDQSEMENRLLVIGEAPTTPRAIGQFGTGLKRALLKLGSSYKIITNSIGKTYVMHFSANNLTDTKNHIEAQRTEEGEGTFTRIEISDLSKAAIMEMFDSAEWVQEFISELGIRYHLFLDKGLIIKFNNIPIAGYCPTLREVGSVKIQEDTYVDLPHNITVKIRAGMHGNYLLSGESGYSEKVNEHLTKEYGWYFVCNDRVVKIACREPKFGWGGKWHPEYYGFVGWVYFIGDAKYMPWNSKKNDIEPNSEIFAAIKDRLKIYADSFRQKNRKLKKHTKKGEALDTDCQDEHQIGLDLGIDTNFTGDIKGLAEDKNNEKPDVVDVHGIKDDESVQTFKPKMRKRIELSQPVVNALMKLGSQKLLQLYHSLCSIDLIQHPVLASVGAWSFFETLAKKSGSTGPSSFEHYFNSKIHQWFSENKADQKVFKKILNDICENGNIDKHDRDYFTIDAKHLAIQFERAEILIIKIIEEIK